MYLFLDRRRCKKFKGPGQIRRMNKASRSPRPGANPFCAAKATPFVGPPLPEDFSRINV